MRTSRRSVVLLVGIAAMVILASTIAIVATGSPKSDEPRGASEDDGGIPVDFSRPFANGTQVDSVAAAKAYLPFSPAESSVAGRPVAVWLKTLETPPAEQAIGLVFDTAPYGDFEIVQDQTDMTSAQLKEIADGCDPAQGCQGEWTMVTLSDGTDALYIGGPTAHSVMWVTKGRRFNIVGHAESMPEEGLMKIANDVQSHPTGP